MMQTQLVSWMGIALTIVGLALTMLAYMIRGAYKWARVESKLDDVVADIRDVVEDKNRVHILLSEQMKEDRKATDRRLRWLEENLWHGRGSYSGSGGDA